MSVRRVALLTAGGFAPCLSSAVGGLIERYNEIDPSVEIIAYQNGYHGLLTGNYVLVDEEARKHAAVLHRFGGSPIGNSRVKLTNKKNLVERGLVSEDEDPLQKAAEQLRADGLVLDETEHTVTVDGERVALTYKEYELLRLFLSHPGTAFSRDQLMADVWGTDYCGETRTVDMHIRTLRQKLGPYGERIETVRGVGYRMEGRA